MYLLDTNIFIEAHRTYYAPDLVPGFWTWLQEQHTLGHLASTYDVYSELKGELGNWVKTQFPNQMWQQPTTSTLEYAKQIQTWVASPQTIYNDKALADLAKGADLTLIAHAAAGNHIIVTRELSSPNSKKRVAIPDAAAQFRVSCISPWDMFRTLKMQL